MKLRVSYHHQLHLIWIGWWPRLIWIDRWPTESSWVAQSMGHCVIGDTWDEALTELIEIIKEKK